MPCRLPPSAALATGWANGMRRRITWAVIVVAVAAVLLAGVGTSVLSRERARQAATSQLSREATALVAFVSDADAGALTSASQTNERVVRRVRAARQALQLVDASVLIVNASGEVVNGTVPAGVPADAVVKVDEADGPRAGMYRNLAYAAVSSEPGPAGRRMVIVLTQDVPRTAGALPWVAVSGVLAVALAIIAAALVAKRISEPFAEIGAATARIANGDFGARVGPLSNADETSAALGHSIDVMAASLEQSQGAQRDFLLSISHDLRTPLTSMRGYAEAIVDGAAPDARLAAAVILDQSVRMERLVADLLDLARLEAHRFTLTMEPVDVVAAVSHAAAAFTPHAERAGLSINVPGEPGPIMVSADPDRLGQVFANLIENALKFARDQVVVEVRCTEAVAKIAVIDDGPGIADGDLARVFDRGFSARTVPASDRPRPASSGLGLAITRELTIAMGGTISVRSNTAPQGTGTSVTIAFAAEA